MPNGAEQYKPKGAFDGYVVAKLEAITDRLNALPCKESFDKINKNSNDIANMKGRAFGIGATLGAIAGFISTMITMFVKHLLEK